MPDYRAYIVGHDGHFEKSVPLECADDDAAKQQVEHLIDGHDIELWQRDRKVATNGALIGIAGKQSGRVAQLALDGKFLCECD